MHLWQFFTKIDATLMNDAAVGVMMHFKCNKILQAQSINNSRDAAYFFHLIEHACRNLVKFDCLDMESLYIKLTYHPVR